MALNIIELIKRPIRKNSSSLEVFNKMTDEEDEDWNKKTMKRIIDEGVPIEDRASALLSKEIDLQILYAVTKINLTNGISFKKEIIDKKKFKDFLKKNPR